MKDCQGCRFFDSNQSYRICLACTGDPDDAHDKVFNPRRKDRKQIGDN